MHLCLFFTRKKNIKNIFQKVRFHPIQTTKKCKFIFSARAENSRIFFQKCAYTLGASSSPKKHRTQKNNNIFCAHKNKKYAKLLFSVH